MADVIVTEDNETDEHERELGRSEGAAAVHVELAAEEAATAEQAAEAAVNAAGANAEIAGEAAAASENAEAAAADAAGSRDAVLVALEAQTAAMTSLVEELRLSRENREQAAPKPVPEAKPTRTPDKAPKAKLRFSDRYHQGR